MEKLLLTHADIKHRHAFAVFAVSDSTADWHRNCLNRLYKRWNEYNRYYFGKRMVEPYLMLSDMAGAKTMGDYAPISGFGGKSQIRIRSTIVTGTYPLTANGNCNQEGLMRIAEDTLLHEMVHQFAHECVGKTEESFHGHGPTFRDECNRVGLALGLGPVRTSKKRGAGAHLPSCSNWPHVVRPNSYYLGAWPSPVSQQIEFWMDGLAEGDEENPPNVLTEDEWENLILESAKLSDKAAAALKKLAGLHRVPIKA